MASATGNFAELLWPGIRSLWGSSYNDYEPLYTKVFSKGASKLRFEKVQQVTGLPLAGVKDEGNAVTFLDPDQGFQKEYSHVTYALGAVVTREMYEDKHSVLAKLGELLGTLSETISSQAAHAEGSTTIH